MTSQTVCYKATRAPRRVTHARDQGAFGVKRSSSSSPRNRPELVAQEQRGRRQAVPDTSTARSMTRSITRVSESVRVLSTGYGASAPDRHSVIAKVAPSASSLTRAQNTTRSRL
jgi:hypothetical protein